MTTIERYRPTKLGLPSDATQAATLRTDSTSSIAKKIPPTAPSPPRLSRSSPPRKPHIQATPSPTLPSLKMTSEESSQWLFNDAEVVSTPSILDGIDTADERCRRAKGVNFIIQAGILLKLPQLTLATASVFFHRFYMRHSMVPEKGGLHHYNIAATALFLATKTEENCRKTKEIVIAVAKVAQKNASLIIDEQSKEYWRWRDNILLYEELMLEYLTFDVVLASPYTILYGFLQKLHIEENKQLRNLSWAFLNDSCLTMMCLLMPPKDIAIGAIYFATKFSRETIPDDENGNSWWDQLDGQVDRIVRATAVMYEFWSENPLRRSENPYAESPTSSDEDLDKTRRSAGSDDQTPSPRDHRDSQGSQNGTSQQEDRTPVVNGNRTAEHTSQISEAKPMSPQEEPRATIEASAANTQDSAPSAEVPKIVEPEPSTEAQPPPSTDEPSGASDSALKEAADESSTHEASGTADSLAAAIVTTEETAKISPKRKSLDDAEEPNLKRAKKLSDESNPATSVASNGREESEEGELEG